VTGAGGSIGSEIVRQVAAFGPASVVLLGRGENSVYQVDREVKRRWPEVARHAVICDVRDRASLRDVFERFRPDVVFHAAAHKHVPLMEANPAQAVLNNVVGTRNVAELACEHGAVRLVNISTDKAVNPTNVMGASKRTAEMVVSSVAARPGCPCTMVSVRFGNVLGSRGSVVPLFREQIARGGPVTVTHPDMVRYFMTIPEASQLVLQAGAFAERGRVYVLDMGEPVRIADLARDLILLSGLEPDEDIEVVYSGARPGEKLFEELLMAEEGTEAGPHEKIFVARKARVVDDLDGRLGALVAAAEANDGDGVRAAFRAVVATYRPDRAAPKGPVAPAALVGGDGATAAGVEVVDASDGQVRR
jgi:FlaA1/EpsC-like NDP-sugar epimerase